MIYKFFDKKSSGSGVNAEPNYQLASELHRQVFKKFKKRKVYSSFSDNSWGVDLAEVFIVIQRHYKDINYLLCVIGISSKYV